MEASDREVDTSCYICKKPVKGQLSQHVRLIHGYSNESARKASFYAKARSASTTITTTSSQTKTEDKEVGKKKVKCPFCSQMRVNMYHHLELHHIEEISTMDDSGKFVKDKKLLAEAMSKTEVVCETNRDKPFYSLCPIPGCASMVKDVTQHLRRRHTLKGDITKDEQRELSKTKIIPEIETICNDISPLRMAEQVRMKTQPSSKKNLFSSFLSSTPESTIHLYKEIGSAISDVSNADEQTEDIMKTPKDMTSYAEEDENEVEQDEGTYLPSDDNSNDDNVSIFCEQFLQKYQRYSTSIMDKNRPQISVIREVRCLKRMLYTIGIEDTLRPLIDNDIVEKKLMVEFASDKKNNSMVTYCSYLTNLLVYVDNKMLHNEVGVTPIEVTAMREKIRNVQKNYRRKAKAEKHVREERECDHIRENLNVNTIKEFKEKTESKAKELFGLYKSVHPPESLNRRDYNIMRDYLISIISFRINQRDGVYLNLQYKELDEAIIIQERYVIKVKEHKGFINHGAARITLQPEEMELLEIFAYMVRPLMEPAFSELTEKRDRYQNPLTKYVFAPWKKIGGNGHLQSGSTAKILTKRLRQEKLIDEDTTISSNDIRKAGIAVLENFHPGDTTMRRKLAKSMTHTESTSKYHYERFQRDVEDVEIQQVMENIVFQTQSTSSEPDHTHSSNVQPLRQKYTNWDSSDEEELCDAISSSPHLKKQKHILELTPKRLKEKYGDDKVITKVRRLLAPISKSDENPISLLPEALRLSRKRKQGSMTIEEENELYSYLEKDILNSINNKEITKAEKATSKNLLLLRLKDTQFVRKYSIVQIRTKVKEWVEKGQNALIKNDR